MRHNSDDLVSPDLDILATGLPKKVAELDERVTKVEGGTIVISLPDVDSFERADIAELKQRIVALEARVKRLDGVEVKLSETP